MLALAVDAVALQLRGVRRRVHLEPVDARYVLGHHLRRAELEGGPGVRRGPAPYTSRGATPWPKERARNGRGEKKKKGKKKPPEEPTTKTNLGVDGKEHVRERRAKVDAVEVLVARGARRIHLVALGAEDLDA